jgi:hypothetical protein
MGFKVDLGSVTNAADTTPWFPAGPGTYTVCVKGTFDSGTVTIQATDDDGVNVLSGGTDLDFTANGFRTLELGAGMKVRATIQGEGASGNVAVVLRPLKVR